MKTQTRRLQVGERVYFYRVLHEHGPRDATGRVEGCRDILTLRSDASRSAPLRLVFEADSRSARPGGTTRERA